MSIRLALARLIAGSQYQVTERAAIACTTFYDGNASTDCTATRIISRRWMAS